MKDLKDRIIEKQAEALNKIANPIGWMQNDAEKRGLRLDGMWAIKIAENPNWLREIAEKALNEVQSLQSQPADKPSDLKDIIYNSIPLYVDNLIIADYVREEIAEIVYESIKSQQSEQTGNVAKTETDTGKLIDMPDLEQPEQKEVTEERELKNPYCRIDALEFFCGMEFPCVQCDCYIENPEPKSEKQFYHLNCDKCGDTYWIQEGFPKPQLCFKCSPPEPTGWDNYKVIDFVNWFLKLIKAPERFELENQTVIDSFLKGEDYKLWWDKYHGAEPTGKPASAEEILAKHGFSIWVHAGKEKAVVNEAILQPILAAMEEYASQKPVLPEEDEIKNAIEIFGYCKFGDGIKWAIQRIKELNNSQSIKQESK